MRAVVVVLALLFLAISVSAQAASFGSMTTPCPANNSNLVVTGLPKLGGSFQVTGIQFPKFCTRRFCGCNIGNCNVCNGSVLVLGLSQVSIPLPGGCSLETTPDVLLFGSTTINVPNNATLSGFTFFLQRMDLALQEVITATCTKAYVPTGFNGFSNLVKGVVGT